MPANTRVTWTVDGQCVDNLCAVGRFCVCVYVDTHESASCVEDDSRRCGRPPVALASHSPVIAVIRRAISQRLMNIAAAAITCEKVNSRTSASINYSLSGRRPGTRHLTPRPSHQGEKEEEPEMEIRDMGLQHTICLLLIKLASLRAQCVLLIEEPIHTPSRVHILNCTAWLTSLLVCFHLIFFFYYIIQFVSNTLEKRQLWYSPVWLILFFFFFWIWPEGGKKTKKAFVFFFYYIFFSFHKKLYMNSISPSTRKKNQREQGWAKGEKNNQQPPKKERFTP